MEKVGVNALAVLAGTILCFGCSTNPPARLAAAPLTGKKIAVFREAYRAIGLGWMLAPTGWPGLRWLADRGYECFARNRMIIGKWFGRKCDLVSNLLLP